MRYEYTNSKVRLDKAMANLSPRLLMNEYIFLKKWGWESYTSIEGLQYSTEKYARDLIWC